MYLVEEILIGLNNNKPETDIGVSAKGKEKQNSQPLLTSIEYSDQM